MLPYFYYRTKFQNIKFCGFFEKVIFQKIQELLNYLSFADSFMVFKKKNFKIELGCRVKLNFNGRKPCDKNPLSLEHLRKLTLRKNLKIRNQTLFRRLWETLIVVTSRNQAAFPQNIRNSYQLLNIHQITLKHGKDLTWSRLRSQK